jgi:S-adenosyl-L-methionine hydrolase (adenosine-forming)
MNRGAAVFFLSDFGLADEFVGVVHAVLQRFAPSTPVIDLTHAIAAFDVAGGAACLERCVDALGPGVVMAVVDPGVGTSRRPIAVQIATEHGPTFFVGPDNGLLIGAAERRGIVTAAYELTSTISTGAVTFDGRDRFAPAAAYLVTGGDPAARYPSIDPTSLVRLEPVLGDATVIGGPAVATATVVGIDGYGNVALNRPGSDLPERGARVTVRMGDSDHELLVVRAFGDLPLGALGLLVDSSDHLAIVVNCGNAAATLGVATGATVSFRAHAHSGN